MIKMIFTWAGIVLGVISAYYWYQTGTVKVTKAFPLRNGIPRYDLSDDVIVKNKTLEIPLIATSVETSRLNKIAALVTAGSMLCQAIAAAIP